MKLTLCFSWQWDTQPKEGNNQDTIWRCRFWKDLKAFYCHRNLVAMQTAKSNSFMGRWKRELQAWITKRVGPMWWSTVIKLSRMRNCTYIKDLILQMQMSVKMIFRQTNWRQSTRGTLTSSSYGKGCTNIVSLTKFRIYIFTYLLYMKWFIIYEFISFLWNKFSHL